jgi:hypothetical protein
MGLGAEIRGWRETTNRSWRLRGEILAPKRRQLGKGQQSVAICPSDKEGDGEAGGDRGKPKGEQGLASAFGCARNRLFHGRYVRLPALASFTDC